MLNSVDTERSGSTTAEVQAEKRSVAHVTLRKPARAAAAADPAAPDGGEGGKGGEGGAPDLPPLPSSNAAFLALVIRGVAEGARAAVCSKGGDPETGGWLPVAAGDVDRQCPSDRNNYLNCSSFVADDEGAVQARVDRFSAYHVLVLDDVGTKVDRDRLAGVTPTWEIETSPGNSQLGFSFSEPVRAVATIDRLQAAVKAADLCDRGALGAARWVRLPYAVNGKAKYRDDAGRPFACRLVQWNPEATYSVEGLATALGIILDGRAQMRAANPTHPRLAADAEGGDCVWTPAPAENPVLTALKALGLYKRKVAPGRHEVTCPWVSEHTDALNTGAAYFEPDEQHDVGGFKCHHSHGDIRRISQLLTRVSDIDTRAVAQWLAEKRGEGLAPATVEKLRVILGRSFELGAKWGVPGCDKNPDARRASPAAQQRARAVPLGRGGGAAQGGRGGVVEPAAQARRRTAAAHRRPGARAAGRSLGERRRRAAAVADPGLEDGPGATRSAVWGGVGRDRRAAAVHRLPLARAEPGHAQAVRVDQAQLADGARGGGAAGAADTRPSAQRGLVHGEQRGRPVRRRKSAGPRLIPEHPALQPPRQRHAAEGRRGRGDGPRGGLGGAGLILRSPRALALAGLRGETPPTSSFLPCTAPTGGG